MIEIDEEMFRIYGRVKAELGDALYKIRFIYHKLDIEVYMKCCIKRGAQFIAYTCTYHRDTDKLEIVEAE